jgi:hypothetical protein
MNKIFFFLFVLLLIEAKGQRFKKDVFASMDSAVNIRYGEAMNIKNEMEALLLDIFMPSEDTMKKRPLVVFIHGGGFQNGNRKVAIAKRAVRMFVPKGYITASIGYRLGIEEPKSYKDYAEAMYRAQQDARSAIRFLKANAARWDIDTSLVFVCGTSAGAMTSLGMAYMDDHEVPVDVNKFKWGPLEGNNENSSHSSKVKAVMNLWGSMIDYRWINKGDVPLYNSAGTTDKTVPYDSSFSYHNFKYGPSILYQRCLALGIPSTWRPFYGVGHTLDSNQPMLDSCFSEMADWLFLQLEQIQHKPSKHNTSIANSRSGLFQEILQFCQMVGVNLPWRGIVLYANRSCLPHHFTHHTTGLHDPHRTQTGFGYTDASTGHEKILDVTAV